MLEDVPVPEEADSSADATPSAVVRVLSALGRTVATAESLTAGQLAASLADVPGASAVLRGGVVAYHNEVKASVLGVPSDLLASAGSVDGRVAASMAEGARGLCLADYGVATTGVAGPDAHDGKPVGTVYVAVAGPEGTHVRELLLHGSRSQIRAESCRMGLRELLIALERGSEGVRGHEVPSPSVDAAVWEPPVNPGGPEDSGNKGVLR